MGWTGLKNGEMLAKAQVESDVFVTTDRNLPYQQNVAKLGIAVPIIEASSNRHEDIAEVVLVALTSLSSLAMGSIGRVTIDG
jgi:hypothetical protein